MILKFKDPYGRHVATTAWSVVESKDGERITIYYDAYVRKSAVFDITFIEFMNMAAAAHANMGRNWFAIDKQAVEG